MAIDRLIGEDYCLNCQGILPDEAWYCPKCGQKCTDGRISIKELFVEFVGAVLNIDSKLFRTLRWLFVPGRLTTEYFIGKRKSYVHPLRLFLVTGVIFFSMVSCITSKYADNRLAKASDSLVKEGAYQNKFLGNLDVATKKVADNFNQDENVRIALDSLMAQMKNDKSDSIEITNWNMVNWEFESQKINVSKLDIINLNNDDLLVKYGITNAFGKFFLTQNIRVMTKLDQLVASAISQFIWTFLFMMVLLGFLLKFLYLRRKIFYVEHLIFSFHFHAFIFLVSSIFLIIFIVIPNFAFANFVWLNLVFVVGLIYLFVSMKRVYKQGWMKTFAKFVVLNFSYLFLFTIALAFSALITVALL